MAKLASVYRARQDNDDSSEQLSIFLSGLASCCAKKELLAARAVCTKSAVFSKVGAVNVDAAVLAVQCTNRWVRDCFDVVERRLCHHSSAWRQGFSKGRCLNREAAFWICRGISRIIGDELPSEVEGLISTFCDNPMFVRISLHSRQLSSLNNLSFHWHRKFSQGSTGPWHAVQLARKTLTSAAADIFKSAAGIRFGAQRAVDLHGRDITDDVILDAQLLLDAMDMLNEASQCMEAHPCKFGQPLHDAKAEDQLQKDENRDEEKRFERCRELGYFVDEDRDVRL